MRSLVIHCWNGNIDYSCFNFAFETKLANPAQGFLYQFSFILFLEWKRIHPKLYHHCYKTKDRLRTHFYKIYGTPEGQKGFYGCDFVNATQYWKKPASRIHLWVWHFYFSWLIKSDQVEECWELHEVTGLRVLTGIRQVQQRRSRTCQSNTVCTRPHRSVCSPRVCRDFRAAIVSYHNHNICL